MATMTQAPSVVSTDAVDRKEATRSLLDHLETMNVKPLWTQMKRVNPPLPNPSAIPYVWRYDELRPKLIQAGDLVDESQAERRVLMLTNPKKEAPCTTDTIFGGLQLVMPNEVAPAHRHTAFAMRFIIEGHGGFTAVNGQRIKMDRGDVILTPGWQWHDHGKDGSGPMIWLDGLDVPSFLHFPVHFVEHYEDPRYPAEDVDKDACPIVFPWAQMRQKLDSAMGTWAALPYLDRDGKEVSKTLGGSAERINAGTASAVRRETASSIYHVVEGSGSTLAGDDKLTWKRGDTFCLPSWYRYQHRADDGDTVYLYRFDDRPMLKALGFYRAEGEVKDTGTLDMTTEG